MLHVLLLILLYLIKKLKIFERANITRILGTHLPKYPGILYN